MSFKRFRKNQGQQPPDLSKIDESISFKIDRSYDGMRLDNFILESMSWSSRARIQKLIKNGEILKNGQISAPAKKVRAGDTITIKFEPPDERDLKILEQGELEFIYEDEFFAVVNKPANLIVHPVAGKRFCSVINLLHKKYRNIEDSKNDVIPIIAHRIDIETSGALLIVKDKNYRNKFVQLFEDRNISKKYLAICEGNLELDEIFVDLPIGVRSGHELSIAHGINFTKGHQAQTIFRVFKRLQGFDVVECELLTGRHHQIRVHIEALGHPLICDPYYGLRRKISTDEIKNAKELKIVENSEKLNLFNNLTKIKHNGREIPYLDKIPLGVTFQQNMLIDKANPEEEFINPFASKNKDENILISRTALHSWKLEFVHPATNENIEITAPLPDDFAKFINALEKYN